MERILKGTFILLSNKDSATILLLPAIPCIGKIMGLEGLGNCDDTERPLVQVVNSMPRNRHYPQCHGFTLITTKLLCGQTFSPFGILQSYASLQGVDVTLDSWACGLNNMLENIADITLVRKLYTILLIKVKVDFKNHFWPVHDKPCSGPWYDPQGDLL